MLNYGYCVCTHMRRPHKSVLLVSHWVGFDPVKSHDPLVVSQFKNLLCVCLCVLSDSAVRGAANPANRGGAETLRPTLRIEIETLPTLWFA